MKNNKISEFNFSKSGKNSVRKYLYLLDKDNYKLNINKILSRKNEGKLLEDDYFNSSNINMLKENKTKDDIIFDDDIFNSEYKNNHNKILEKQKAKYYYKRDKYKYHISHLKLKKNKFIHKNSHNLLLFYDNNESEKNINNLLKKIAYSQSFEKMIGRNDIIINKENKNKSKDKIINENEKSINSKEKENKIENKINIGGGYVALKNQTMKGNVPRHNDVRIRIEKKFEAARKDVLCKNKKISERIINLSNEKSIINDKLPFIKCYKNKDNLIVNSHLKNKIENHKKYNYNNNSLFMANLENNNKTFSKDDHLNKHIKGISFSNMLSRVRKNIKNNEIKNICYPCTPNYSYIYPKIVMKVFYNDNIPKKDFSHKLKSIKDELIFDIDKVYNKYNNHKEPKSFSLDKMIGRNNIFLKPKDDKNKKELINEKTKNILTVFNVIKSSFNNKPINDSKIKNNNYKYENIIIYNSNLENSYKKLMNKIFLNKQKISEEDKKLKRILSGNKININYKKLLKYFNRIQIK